jgi:hypothetical protein
MRWFRHALIFALVSLVETSFAQFSPQGSRLAGSGNVGGSCQGNSVALSSGGNTLIIGAAGDDFQEGAVPGDTASSAVLSVVSRPTGADVLIDGAMVGRTPVRISSILPGTHALAVSLSGFCDFRDSVVIERGIPITREVQLDSACGLSIVSNPDSAGIYLDDIYVGKSPLRLANVKPGWRSVKLSKRDCAIWEDRVLLVPGNVVSVQAKLRSRFGTLNLEVFSPDIQVAVDGKRIGAGSLVDYMIPSGWHDIGAVLPASADSVGETIYIRPGETARWEARFAVPSMKSFWYSLLLPGLGQTVNRSPGEGFALMGGFLAACVAGYLTNVLYHDRLTEYDDARAAYESMTTEAAAKSAGDALAGKHEDLNASYKLRSVVFGVAGAIYLYSLVDAFFNHDTDNLISPLTLNTRTRVIPSLALTPGGNRFSIAVTF